MKTRMIITRQSPRGDWLNICDDCDKETHKDAFGEDFCTVSHGRRRGVCDVCTQQSRQKRAILRAAQETGKLKIIDTRR